MVTTSTATLQGGSSELGCAKGLLEARAGLQPSTPLWTCWPETLSPRQGGRQTGRKTLTCSAHALQSPENSPIWEISSQRGPRGRPGVKATVPSSALLPDLSSTLRQPQAPTSFQLGTPLPQAFTGCTPCAREPECVRVHQAKRVVSGWTLSQEGGHPLGVPIPRLEVPGDFILLPLVFSL